MSNIQAIEEAIGKPREDFLRIREGIQRRFDDQWDEQFEKDVAAGRLDRLGEQALAEHRAGRSTPFPTDAEYSRPQSIAVRSFWDRYHGLPADVQRIAVKQYRLWLHDPRHPSVRFKRVCGYWSARKISSRGSSTAPQRGGVL